MTPQLQQAIRLLQLSTLDLEHEIQEILDTNMMLERAEDSEIPPEETNTLNDTPATQNTTTEQDMDFNKDDSLTTTLDSNWEESFEYYSSNNHYTNHNDDFPLENNAKLSKSLQEHLLWQMELSHFSSLDTIIATTIIDAIDVDGYLRTSLEDIVLSVNQALYDNNPTPLSEAQKSSIHGIETVTLEYITPVLKQIQNFDPIGVAAQDLSESLNLQLKAIQATLSQEQFDTAQQLVTHYLDLLAKHDYAQIKRHLRINDTLLKNTVDLITSLNPRPGSQISDENPRYITPDVYVRKIKEIWQVELNPNITPQLNVNEKYAALLKGMKKTTDISSLKDQLQEARWFIKNLQNRNDTLLKVARCIVAAQQDFFEHGEEAMKAMVLRDIAEQVEMHESTISRVTNQKYIHTPGGIYELKYFFSSHVRNNNGEEVSAIAIRAILKKLIDAEDAKKPLSDNKLSQLLAEQGYKVARRTVAKYREALSIPASNERKIV